MESARFRVLVEEKDNSATYEIDGGFPRGYSFS